MGCLALFLGKTASWHHYAVCAGQSGLGLPQKRPVGINGVYKNHILIYSIMKCPWFSLRRDSQGGKFITCINAKYKISLKVCELKWQRGGMPIFPCCFPSLSFLFSSFELLNKPLRKRHTIVFNRYWVYVFLCSCDDILMPLFFPLSAFFFFFTQMPLVRHCRWFSKRF